jgi:hypothetical protein
VSVPLNKIASRTEEDVVAALLPIAAALDADAWRIFLAVCEEDGVSVHKLGRMSGLGQSAVIRATSVLESWCQENRSCNEAFETGLLRTVTDTKRHFRRNSYLTAAGVQLREMLRHAFGVNGYVEQALAIHLYLQEALAEASKLAA